MPTAKTAQKPHAPCTAKASRGSSILSFTRSMDAPLSTNAPMKPITMDAHGSTTTQPAVMDTRPPRMPLPTAITSHTCDMRYSMATDTRPAVAAERVVVTHTRARSRAYCTPRANTERVEPPLKPYQPIHRMKTPRIWSTELCPGMCTGLPSVSNRPIRGPRKAAPMSADTPPVMCTTPDPAKSTQPPRIGSPEPVAVLNAESMPSESQTQCTTTG
mmetsp:Transcript_2069/g.5209  ORF Transcript_2069/g.5209 Transcript_2069/m.5209 type:complete len:216 (+) Transcript_2069:617-1264(+)